MIVIDMQEDIYDKAKAIPENTMTDVATKVNWTIRTEKLEWFQADLFALSLKNKIEALALKGE